MLGSQARGRLPSMSDTNLTHVCCPLCLSAPRRGKDKPCNKCPQTIYLEEDLANGHWVAKNLDGSPHLCPGNGQPVAPSKPPPAKPPTSPQQKPSGPVSSQGSVIVGMFTQEAKNQIKQLVQEAV